MAQTHTVVADEEVGVGTVIAPVDIVKKRTIAAALPETITEAVGEPERDQDLLTMIDTIVQMAETVVMEMTDTGSVARHGSERSPRNAPLAHARRASPQHRSLPRMSVIDEQSLFSSSPRDYVPRNSLLSSRRLAQSKKHRLSRIGSAVDPKGACSHKCQKRVSNFL